MNCSIVVGMTASFAILGAGSVCAYGAAIPTSSFAGGTYVQDFNTLNGGVHASADAQDFNSGTPEWSNGTTLPGWHAWVTNPTGAALTPGVPGFYTNSDGSTSQRGRLLNLGTDNTADRALGLSQANTTNQYIGVQLSNDTGSALTGFTVTYDAEQWRLIQNTVAEKIEVQYRIFNAGGGSVNAANAGDWITLPSLTYTSATTAGATTALNGNLAANRTADLTATVAGVDWQSGQELWVRWANVHTGTSAHQVGIDNVRIAVPEPASAALVLGAIGLNLFRGRKP